METFFLHFADLCVIFGLFWGGFLHLIAVLASACVLGSCCAFVCLPCPCLCLMSRLLRGWHWTAVLFWTIALARVSDNVSSVLLAGSCCLRGNWELSLVQILFCAKWTWSFLSARRAYITAKYYITLLGRLTLPSVVQTDRRSEFAFDGRCTVFSNAQNSQGNSL